MLYYKKRSRSVGHVNSLTRSKYATVGREYRARSMLGDRPAPVGGGGYPSPPPRQRNIPL